MVLRLITLFMPLFLGVHVALGVQKSFQEIIREDIDFIYTMILENHPGVCNDQDPTFVVNMNQFYQIAVGSIAQAHKPADHIKIINDFLESFHDTHLRCYRTNGVRPYKKKLQKSSDFKLCCQDGIVWVALPTFQLNDNQQAKLENIIDQMAEYRNASVIVFDVRGNSGGNSAWAMKLIEALFTSEYAKFCMYQVEKNVVVDWRVSRSNIDYLTSMLPLLCQQFGLNSSMVDEFQSVLEGMHQAQEQCKSLYSEKAKLQLFKKMYSVNPVAAKIVVVMNGSCVSACLDFIDMLKAMNCNLTLIGKTTNADTVYMEVRVVDLPSEIGMVQFPIKMYRNRLRGHNKPYVPDIEIPISCTKKKDVERWITLTIKDLMCQGNN